MPYLLMNIDTNACLHCKIKINSSIWISFFKQAYTFSTWCVTFILIGIHYFASFNFKYAHNWCTVISNVFHLCKQFLFLFYFFLYFVESTAMKTLTRIRKNLFACLPPRETKMHNARRVRDTTQITLIRDTTQITLLRDTTHIPLPTRHYTHNTPTRHYTHYTTTRHHTHSTPTKHYTHYTTTKHYTHYTPTRHHTHYTPTKHYTHYTPTRHYTHYTPTRHYTQQNTM